MLVGLGLLLGHHLDQQRPAREIAALDRVEQIAPVALAILGDDRGGLFVGEVLDALLRAEVEFDPDALIGGVDHREGVAAEEMHVTEASRDATVGHHNGHLVQRFRQERPEVPVVVGRAQTGARIALDRVVQVREAQRIAKEEDGRIVADDVPVAFLGIELHGSTADIAFGIRRAALARHRREAGEHRRLLADLGEDLRLGVAGDIVGDGEGAMGAPTLCMHAAFGNHLTVEMCQLLDQPDVLEQRRTARARRLNVGVVHHGRTGGMGHRRGAVGHDHSCVARHRHPGDATALR